MPQKACAARRPPSAPRCSRTTSSKRSAAPTGRARSVTRAAGAGDDRPTNEHDDRDGSQHAVGAMSVRYHSVGPFEVVSRLGSGGMADVLKAVDGRNGRIVALKIPKTHPGVREAEREGALLHIRLSEIDPRVPRVVWIDESVGNEIDFAMGDG